MAKTRNMTRNQNYDDASNRKRIKTCNISVVTLWSDVNHDVLFLVMMRLGVVDFLAFGGVCKSWRSLAVSHRNEFMASKPPMEMQISISVDTNEKDDYCCLQDFEGRKFRTILPHSVGRKCHGITCGYLILYGRETNDFWLVNPITRHQLHFPGFYHYVSRSPLIFKAILVFSPSRSGWVYLMVDSFTNNIWFSIAGKGTWNHVSTAFHIQDIHVFKGKIYALDAGDFLWEMKLNPQPKLNSLETKNFPKRHQYSCFVSSGENLYLIENTLQHPRNVQEIDFSEMKWILHEKTPDEYTFFHSSLQNGVFVKPELWADPQSQYGTYSDTDKSVKGKFFTPNMWYFPHDYLNVNLIHE